MLQQKGRGRVGRCRRFVLCLLVAALLGMAAATNAPANHDDMKKKVQALMDWVVSKGGAVSPHQEYKRKPDGSFGMFAKETIPMGELLYSVPWQCLVMPQDNAASNDDADALQCDTIEAVLEKVYDYQQEQGSDNKFGPYLDYLVSLPRGIVPSTWSEEGKDLLEDIGGHEQLPPVEPVNWIDKDFELQCRRSGHLFEDNDKDSVELQDHLAMMVLSRAAVANTRNAMVPLYDLYNHRCAAAGATASGAAHLEDDDKTFNADVAMTPGKMHGLRATRTIDKGEEICVSYTSCRHAVCQRRKDEHYGTPEVLRDYGVVESYPQLYYFDWLDFGFRIDVDHGENANDDDDDADDSDDNEEEKESYIVTWESNVPTREDVSFLHWQLLRLLYVVGPNVQALRDNDTNVAVPPHERQVLLHYYDSLVIALTEALKKVGIRVDDNKDSSPYSPSSSTLSSICLGEPTTDGKNDKDGECTLIHHYGYDSLDRVNVKFMNYQSYCDNADIVTMKKDLMRLIDRNVRAQVQSPFQQLTFMDRQVEEEVDKDGNVVAMEDQCLELDDMLQICTSFRPHYHEFVTHFPARYKEEIRRVLFVGGGDSMVLHEMLKYPKVELIVGLELDQAVVRSSMKQFRTQPHFDDERVQWWFGDATKSLLMLPKEYFGSFDLVMVDLSESVMSFSVIKHVDIMEALTLLLKPDGIMIKNDLHFRKMSDIFDYTIQLSVTDVPIICEQAFVVGSNSIDFLRPNVDTLIKGHDVEMLLLDPITNLSDSFKFVQKYRKNDARAQEKCDNHIDDADVKLKRAGLFMVVEAEDIKGPLKGEEFEEALQSALKKEGLRTVSTFVAESVSKGSHFVIVMREGIVVARTWPNEEYCAFDIHLWGRFNAMDSVKKSLVEAVKSPKGSVSSFRIVVGGMRGTDTWQEDKAEIGPKIVQNRDCSENPGTGTIDDDVIDVVVEESLNLIQEKDPLVVVMCGNKNDPCRSLNVIQESKVLGDNKAILALYACPEIENVDFMGDGPVRISACELTTLKTLRQAVAADRAISALVFDPSSPIAMGKIVRNIFRNPRHKDKFLMSNIMFVAPMLSKEESWRRTLLDRSRNNLRHDHVFRTEFSLRAKEDKVKVDILSSGDADVFSHLVDFASAVQARTGVITEIQDIIGAAPKETDIYKPIHFRAEDYDPTAGEAQFSQQKPLGHHIVSLFKVSKEDRPSTASLETQLVAALETSLAAAKFSESSEVQVFDDVGDGIVAVAVAPQGTAVAVWDGNQRMTLNMFTFDSVNADTFMTVFMRELPWAKIMSRDEQPRGVGRVINFARDL